MIRVAHLIQSVDAPSGGTSTAFLQLMAALASRPGALAARAFTLRPPPGDPAHEVITREPDRWTLADGTGRFGPGDLGKRVIGEIRAGRVDVLHIHGVWLPDLVAAANAARAHGVACFWQPHGMLLEHALSKKAIKKQVFLRLGLGRALAGASGVVYCSAGERAHTVLPRGGADVPGHVVFLPVTVPEDAARIAPLRAEGRERFGIGAGERAVAFMGRLHPVKRLEMTMRAFAAAAEQEQGLRLVLFGAGEESYARSLRELAATLGIAGRTTFAGWIQGEDKWRALAASDVLLLNSLHENFGYTVPEALGVYTPVVMTENLDLAADVAAGSGKAEHPFCRSVAPEEGALSRAIIETVRSPLTPRAAEAARRWVLETFSPGAIADQLVSIYRGPAQRRAGAGLSVAAGNA